MSRFIILYMYKSEEYECSSKPEIDLKQNKGKEILISSSLLLKYSINAGFIIDTCLNTI